MNISVQNFINASHAECFTCGLAGTAPVGVEAVPFWLWGSAMIGGGLGTFLLVHVFFWVYDRFFPFPSREF